jgi:hypothetical protein
MSGNESSQFQERTFKLPAGVLRLSVIAWVFQKLEMAILLIFALNTKSIKY